MLDFDGVIADSLEPTVKAVQTAFEEHGLAALNERLTMQHLVSVNWFVALRQAGVPPAVMRAIDDHVADFTAQGLLHPYPGIARVIESVSRRHVVIVMTSNRTDIVETFLLQWRIDGITETLGGDKGESKVVKIRKAIERHGLHSAWFVGDTTGDVLEGREAGVTTVGAAWGWHGRQVLASASPDFVLDSPSALLDLLVHSERQ